MGLTKYGYKYGGVDRTLRGVISNYKYSYLKYNPRY